MGYKYLLRDPEMVILVNNIFIWISNHIPGNMGDEITYPFLNFNGTTVEV